MPLILCSFTPAKESPLVPSSHASTATTASREHKARPAPPGRALLPEAPNSSNDQAMNTPGAVPAPQRAWRHRTGNSHSPQAKPVLPVLPAHPHQQHLSTLSSPSSSANPQSCLWPHLGMSTGISLSKTPLGRTPVRSAITLKWQLWFSKQLQNIVNKC